MLSSSQMRKHVPRSRPSRRRKPDSVISNRRIRRNVEHTCGMEGTSCAGMGIGPGERPSVRPRLIGLTAKLSIEPDHERLFSLAVRDAGAKARLFTDDFEIVIDDRQEVDIMQTLTSGGALCCSAVVTVSGTCCVNIAVVVERRQCAPSARTSSTIGIVGAMLRCTTSVVWLRGHEC